MPIVTLLTDFGSRDAYVSQVKAVILSECPNVTLIDISHEVKKFSIREGAFLLASATPYFPKGTIHLAVVDPGVGGVRRGLVIESRNALYVGPDNGLLSLAANRDGVVNAYCIESRFARPSLTSVFHGRDLFAPVAGKLASGMAPNMVGEKTSRYAHIDLPQAKAEGDRIQCEVIHIDEFGNVITNVTSDALEKFSADVRVVFRGRSRLAKHSRAYTDAGIGELVALVGSHGFLELGINQGNAALKLGARVGDKLKMRPG